MAPCGKRRGTPPTVVVRSTSTGRWGTRCRKFDENDHVRPGRSTRWPGKKADSALRLRAAQERQISYLREQTRLATACLSTSLLCRTARARVPGRDVGRRDQKIKGYGYRVRGMWDVLARGGRRNFLAAAWGSPAQSVSQVQGRRTWRLATAAVGSTHRDMLTCVCCEW